MGARAAATARTVGRESDLYPPVKMFLEAQGYDVKGEIGGCDAVGTRGAEPPVIVELKRQFNLALVLQGVDRLSLTDRVYLAVPRRHGRRAGVSVYHRDVRTLCRRLGLGLMAVETTPSSVEVVLDPEPYRPRKKGRRLGRLLGEHARRVGDPTRGGVTRMPIVTAYRQEALRCALLIRDDRRTSLKALRETGAVPNASRILQRDVYGWFQRVSRATYTLTERAARDLARFASAGTLPDIEATRPSHELSRVTTVMGAGRSTSDD
jgi:hypothetical protein